MTSVFEFPKRMAIVAASIAALFALQIAPVSAQSGDEEAPNTAPLPDFSSLNYEEAVRAFSQDGERWFEEPCVFGVPLLARMQDLEPGLMPVQRAALLAQAFCADEEERYADGAQIMRMYNALDPAEADAGLTLYFANRTGDAGPVLDLFEMMRGEVLSDLDVQSFSLASQIIAEAGRAEELGAIALGWFEDNQIGFFNSDLHGTLAMRALAQAGRENRGDMTDQLLVSIISPASYVRLLSNREYEIFWPKIAERAGSNLSDVGAEYVETTRRRLVNAPRDRDRFSAAAYALHFNGDFEEAIALAQSWSEREERGLALEEGDAWALNIEAYAYDSLGQRDEADAVFERLAALDPEENNWVVNFVINRASRLVGHGRWEEGLAAAQLARSVPGSTYAEMIVARDFACALRQLGRSDEAEAELNFLRENSKTSVHIAAVGLLCHGLRDETAQMLSEGLGETATRSSAIEALQIAEADLFYTQSMLPAPRALMDEYPELAAEYAKYARDLPADLIPRASTLRVRLDLPIWE